MRCLQEWTGKSACLRPAKPGLAALHTLGEAYFMPSSLQGLLSAASCRPRRLVPGMAPARLPAGGVDGIVRSIYGDSAQIRQNQQQPLVGDACSCEVPGYSCAPQSSICSSLRASWGLAMPGICASRCLSACNAAYS